MSGSNRLISIIFSFRNEEKTLTELIKRVRQNLRQIPVDYELIFVNDCSTDRSLDILNSFAREDNRIKIINLSRRFGYNQSFLAGLRYSRGEAVITMDADLQDPPETISKLIEKWIEGIDIVHTVRSERKGENILKINLTTMAYRLINTISNIKLLDDAGNFKLISRRAADELLKLDEKDPYLRGLVAWVGFKQDRIFYMREKRYAGKSHFPIFRSIGPVREFLSGVTSFSGVPLTFSLVFGYLLIFASLISAIILCILKLGKGSFGWWHLNLVLTSFIAGVQLICLGFVGLYIGRIWNEVNGRPNYIVESTINLDKEAGR